MSLKNISGVLGPDMNGKNNLKHTIIVLKILDSYSYEYESWALGFVSSEIWGKSHSKNPFSFSENRNENVHFIALSGGLNETTYLECLVSNVFSKYA